MRVIISRLEKADVLIDPDYGTPIGGSAGMVYKDVEIEGQVNLANKSFQALMRSQAGDQSKTFGYIVVLKAEMERIGYIKKGDKIKEVGPLAAPTVFDDVVVVEVRGQAPLRGDFLFYHVEFEENKTQHSVS